MEVMTRLEMSSAQLEYVCPAESSVPWLSATAMRNLLKMSPPSGLDLQVRTETMKPMETR